MGTWDVMTPITKWHFYRLCASSPGKKLVTKTYSEDWKSTIIHHRSDIVNGSLEHRRVSGPVRYEEAIILLINQGCQIVIPWHNQNLDTP